MPRPLVFLGVLAFSLASPAVASATTSVFAPSGNGVVVTGAASSGMDIVIDSPSAGTITVTNHAPGETVEAGTNCTADAGEQVVTCPGLTPAEFRVEAFGSAQADSIEVAETAAIQAGLYGAGGDDVLLGGAGNDTLGGNLGKDDLDGRGGSDLINNGFTNSNVPNAGDDGDLYRDTGTSGTDSLNYGFQTVGVHMSVDGQANDGAGGGAEGDDIRGGFERLRGTDFADVIVGGPADEVINGSEGDDDLTGGPGADTIEGNEGVDTVRGRDGEVDLVLDCDSASSHTQGTGETAYIDAADPEPFRCETVERAAGAGGGGSGGAGGGGGGGTDPGTGGTTSPPPGTVPTPEPTLAPLKLGPVAVTETVSRMPRVTGKKFAAARDEVLKVVAFAQVDIEFKRGCSKGDFLEVTKQTPITGASLSTDVRSPAQVTLVACIAEADYLRDCDMASVKEDVKRLGSKALDADVAMSVLTSVNRCKVDYDVKIAKAAEETRIKLEAQRASEALEKAARDKANAKKQADDKVKADLRANITCPIGGSLNVGLIDGYTPNRHALGFKQAASANDPDAWTLPSHPRADYQSFITVSVSDRSAQFPEARVFLDTDDVTDADTVRSKSVTTTKKGLAILPVRPEKAGWIRVCVVVETGGDRVISRGLEIRVGPQPKIGTVWETQNGRRIKLTANGPVAEKAATPAAERKSAEPVAGKAFFGDLWNALVGLFSGRSKAMAKQAASGGEGRLKLAAVAETARVGVGQITLGARLQPNPQPPTLNPSGSCLTSYPDGRVAFSKCPVLEARGGAAIVGLANDGTGVMAYGHDNVLQAAPGNTILAGKGKLVGLDGGTLIGNDGSTLVGTDGASLIGNDGSTLVGTDGASLIGNDGSTLIGNDGSTLIGNDGSTFTGALGASALSVAPAQLIARDGAGLVNGGAGLVAAGSLN